MASGAGVGNQELALIVKLRGYGMRCGEELGNGTGDQELETSANCDWELTWQWYRGVIHPGVFLVRKRS